MAKTKDDRRGRFAQEYVKDLNVTAAAIRAGYSPKTAASQGSRLLKDAKVRVDVDARLAKVATRNEITVERTLKEIARIAYGDVRKLYNADGSLKKIGDLDEDAAAQIAGVEVDTTKVAEEVTISTAKLKRWDKVKALDQCMAYLGMHKTANPTEGGGLALTINLSGGKRVR
jgi:phage terminase small subunit